jgi:hypothetical protein
VDGSATVVFAYARESYLSNFGGLLKEEAHPPISTLSMGCRFSSTLGAASSVGCGRHPFCEPRIARKIRVRFRFQLMNHADLHLGATPGDKYFIGDARELWIAQSGPVAFRDFKNRPCGSG